MPKVVLVAGASCSFGSLLCMTLANKGYFVYAGYNNHLFPKNISNSICPVKLDIRSEAACALTVKKITKKKKRLDAVINLVGIGRSGPFEGFKTQDFLTLLDINSVGAFRLMKTAMPFIPKFGKIINVGSICGNISFPNFSIYSASKAALRALSITTYFECLSKKRFVTLISLGGISVKTPQKISNAAARKRIPLLNWLLPLLSHRQVVEKIVKVLETKNPSPEVLVGRDTIFLTSMQRFLPSRLWDTIQGHVWQRQQ